MAKKKFINKNIPEVVYEVVDEGCSGKPIFMSRSGRAYKEINGTKLLQLKDKL